jgi:hypothetical protein
MRLWRFPKVSQRAIGPGNRIRNGQFHSFNRLEIIRACCAGANIRMLMGWVSPDDRKVSRASKVLMACSCRQDEAITGRNVKHLPSGTSDKHPGTACCYPENFVGFRVIMLVRKYAVAATSLPAICLVTLFKNACNIKAAANGCSIEEHRQVRVIWHPVARTQFYRLRHQGFAP